MSMLLKTGEDSIQMEFATPRPGTGRRRAEVRLRCAGFGGTRATVWLADAAIASFTTQLRTIAATGGGEARLEDESGEFRLVLTAQPHAVWVRGDLAREAPGTVADSSATLSFAFALDPAVLPTLAELPVGEPGPVRS